MTSIRGFIFGIFLLFAPGFSAQGAAEMETVLPEGVSINVINHLLNSPRIIRAGTILEDFLENGATTTRVIVNLREAETFDTQSSLEKTHKREYLATRIHVLLDRVLQDISPAQVQKARRFKYMAGFSARVTLEGLGTLVDDPDVLSIEKDVLLYPNLAQGIPLMNASEARSSYSGEGLSVAICDTGIDYNHMRLGNSGFPNGKVIGGYDTGDDDNDPMDMQGHGTACAGIVAGNLGTVGDYAGGVAYNAKLYALKITRGSGSGAYNSDILQAWEWCITHQYDDPDNPILVINLSFGGGRYSGYCDAFRPAYAAAAGNVVAAGIALFVSSGNAGYCDSLGEPACISNVISVGAVYDANLGRNPPTGYVGCIKSGSCVGTQGPPCDEKWYLDEPANADQVATYSNNAPFLDLLAPSNWATTTELGGGYWDIANGFGGTSAASPYAAGAAACLQSAAKAITGTFLTPDQLQSTLMNTGDSITDTKVAITKPRVNLGNAVAALGGGGSASYVEPSGTCGGNSPCYASIQDAMNSAASGETIKISQDATAQALNLNTAKNIMLQGGWDPSFTARTSYTNITSLIIQKGSVVVESLILQ